ncbi:MAG: acyl-[ACP]--phospholipid O-acyltransferase [Legionellales bacterium]|nr:acyl-[ACP]--phospholipid O-acyltransferase [Legionellales bacterium]
MKTTEIDLLKTKRFLPLFITQFFGAFNDNVFKNALVILITYRLASLAGVNPQILVILAAGIFILPFFLFSATAGQLADKYEKSRIISIIKFIEILLMILVTVGFYFQSISLLMFCLFLLGTHSTFFGPLKYAILPDQLKENELIAGNGLIEAGTFIAILLGTLTGGLFVLQPHGESIISLLVLGIAIAGWGASLFIPKTSNFNHELKVQYNIIKETNRLIQYSRTQWDIFLSILGISWFWLVGSVFLSELPVFAKNILHTSESVVTFFLTLFSIGLAIGSLLCNKLLKGKVHATYVPLGALGITLFTIDLYFAANHISMPLTEPLISFKHFLMTFTGWRITVDLLLVAICGGIYTVPLYAILQQRSEKAHRARVIASNNVINALFMVIAAVATILMSSIGLSVTQVFLVIAIANAGVAIYICKLLPDILIRSIFHFILKTLYRVKVKGLENYFEAGERVVIIANHTSFLDALLLAVFLPDKLTFAVNTTAAKKGWIKFFLRMVDAFPIDPTNPMAIKSLINLLQENKRCVIFPEGRITMTGALMKIYEGPGLIADKSGAKLLPVHIEGAHLTPFSRLKGKLRTHWMPTITMTIFPAQKLEVAAEIKGRKRRVKIGYQLYDLMTQTQFESSNYKKTLFASLLEARSLHGSRTEIIEDIERAPFSYHKLITYSFILGGKIAKNTSMSEHVGILLPNMVSTVTTFFALQAFSRIPAMLNYSTGINNVVIACQTANIKTIYTSLKFVRLAKLTEMVSALKKQHITVIYLEELRSQLSLTNKMKGFLLALFPALGYRFIHRTKALNNADNAAVILFTSGSEGSPKAVVLSHANIQANRYQLSACIDMTASDKVFNALPIFHSFGLTAGMLLPLLSGVKIFFYPSPLHYRIIPELVYDTNSTILFGTDTFLSAYAKHAHPYDFYSVRYVFSGAEKLRDETRINWSQKFGVRIFEGYGATETAPVISMNTPMQNKIGTVGRLLPGMQYRLKSVPGIEEGGVLSVSGANIMKGYLLAENPGQLVAPAEGWYDTGDVVSIDEAGFITIKGRVKRFAKIGGEMVSLTMVEQEINKLWPEYQHAVIAKPDPKKGEQLVLITTYPEATREAVITYAKMVQMGDITVPKNITIVKNIPLLGTGKIDYPSLNPQL